MTHGQHRENDFVDGREETHDSSTNELNRQQRKRVAWVYLVMVGVLVTLAVMLAIAAGVLGQP